MHAIRKVFETEWFSIDARFSSASDERPYYILSCNDSVGILAMTPNRRMVFVRQFRPALGISLLEFPSGGVDSGESPHEAIVRELEEETGYVCDAISFLGPFRLNPSRVNSTLYLFFGGGARLDGTKSPEDEASEVVLLAEDEFKELIVQGDFSVVAGLALYQLVKSRGLL